MPKLPLPKREWTVLNGDTRQTTYCMPVPGGMLYRVTTTEGVALVFVPEVTK